MEEVPIAILISIKLGWHRVPCSIQCAGLHLGSRSRLSVLVPTPSAMRTCVIQTLRPVLYSRGGKELRSKTEDPRMSSSSRLASG